MRYEARVEITHLPGIADPQGATVERSLPAPQSDLARELLKDPYSFDFLTLTREAEERDLERGLVEHIRLVIDAPDADTARAQVDEMCQRLLANPVIEAYAIELSELVAAP